MCVNFNRKKNGKTTLCYHRLKAPYQQLLRHNVEIHKDAERLIRLLCNSYEITSAFG